jgi:anti-sigma regulatory factor (Ser/Thr protein kinase)
MSAQLQHDALIYDSDEKYLAAMRPFLLEGLDSGQGVAVATNERNKALLAKALGDRASEVLFVPGEDVYATPETAIRSYHGVIELFRRQGKSSVRAIGEVDYTGDTPRWLRYEPIAHSVFEASPLHVTCPYDARTLPSELVEHARKTHPHLLEESGRASNEHFIAPLEVLQALGQIPSILPSSKPSMTVRATVDNTTSSRRAITDVVARVLSPERTSEAVLAIAEVVTNGLKHGRGSTTASLWTLPDRLVCLVRNAGPTIDDPLAGYRPPKQAATGGMGLWIARQLADRLEISADSQGPVVVLGFDRIS